MSIFARATIDPAQAITRKIQRLERQNASAVGWDHRFGVVGILTIAVAALIGMAADAVVGALAGTITRDGAVQLIAAFTGVLVMNRGLLAAARNIRRAESRGELPLRRDQITMWGVMAIESISFGFMLWIFEGRPAVLTVAFLLIVLRAGVLPYSTVYLEMQREQPPDPVDIGVQTEIGQGLGVMGDLVRQAYDRDIPTALKIHNYRANATMTPEMDQRLERMTQAAQAYEVYKTTGRITLLDQHGRPLVAQRKPSEGEPPAPRARAPRGHDDEIAALRHEGKGIREIARETRRPVSTVHAAVKRVEAGATA